MFNKKLLVEKDKRIAELQDEIKYLRSKLDAFIQPTNYLDRKEENILLDGAMVEVAEYSDADIKKMQEAEKEAEQMFMGELIEVN